MSFKQQKNLFTIKQLNVAAIIGGPFTGGLLLVTNHWRLGKKGMAILVFAIGVFLASAKKGIVLALNQNFGYLKPEGEWGAFFVLLGITILINLLYAFFFSRFIRKKQEGRLRIALSQGRRMISVGRALLIYVLLLLYFFLEFGMPFLAYSLGINFLFIYFRIHVYF